MKKILFLFLIIPLVFNCSCLVQRSISTQTAENNSDYKVSYLFEHDGCKVYRFHDVVGGSGRYVYFTNCTGEVTVAANDSVDTQIQTIGRARK